MLDFRLKVFQSVARNLSFTKASNELFISQPAITKHIKELESEFEVKLFDRVGNKIALTEAGNILLTYSEQISALHNELKFTLSRLNGKAEGSLRVGASTTIAQYIIPPLLAKFHDRFPGVSLSLTNGNTDFVEHQLLKNEIDIGIVEGKPTNSDLRYSSFINDELLIFTSAQNSAIPQTISVDEFTKLPLVLRERGSGTLEIIGNKLQEQKIRQQQLNVLMYLGSTEAIKSFVKTGEGAGIVSRFAIEQELGSGIFRIIGVENLKFERQLYFISPKGPEPVGLPKIFINFIQKCYNL
jgi:DNA-binding transcriptional LysR family regulator